VRRVLLVTLLLLTGQQVMYTYVAPYLSWAGFGRTGLVLMIFGVATIGGVWVAGLRADRHARSALAVVLAAFVIAMAAVSVRVPALLVGGVVVWGVAYGAAPTLLQTLLIRACGPGDADVATALQTTVYNVGIALGSLLGGIVLGRFGAGLLPWGTALLAAAALLTAALTAALAAEQESALSCRDIYVIVPRCVSEFAPSSPDCPHAQRRSRWSAKHHGETGQNQADRSGAGPAGRGGRGGSGG
jgi:predicted MFS family arabinose efflux permease